MAQINLLKQNSNPTANWDILPKLVVRVLLFIVLGLFIYYIWLFVSLNSINNKIVNAKADIEKKKQESLTIPGRDEVMVRQQQIKALNEAIGSHLYWSKLMPKIAEVTLKTASYSGLRVNSDGILRLTVNVPDLQSLDKYLQVFNLPEVNKNFSDVNISGFHKVQAKDSTSISFEVSMKINPSIIQYSESK